MLKPNRWTLLIALLSVVIIGGGLTIWARYPHSQPLEISSSVSETQPGTVNISGAVNCPGFYPWKAEDTIDTLIQFAGGYKSDADTGNIGLHIPQLSVTSSPQKVDIDRAESWLLQALPGIGEARAMAIIDYRIQNGPFRHIHEITYVEGIGPEL